VSGKPCARLWQAEAVLDGVLSRADAASFERHAATCAECTAERAALLRLGSVAERMPSLAVTPLRRRALHHELLRRANEASVGARPARFARFRLLVPICVCLLAALVVLWRFSGNSSPSALARAPSFELSAAPHSRWHVAQPGSSLRLALEGGTFTISVQKLGKAQRFSLALPDGELEVRGTRFTVECDAHRTRRVVVEEGRVALRLAGQPELSLGPGQAWPAETAQSPSVAPAPSVDMPPSASSAQSSTTLDAGKTRKPARYVAPRRFSANAGRASDAAPHASSATTVAAGVSASAASPSTAAREFASAMSAFSQGDFGMAEQLFRAFEQRYPQNPHVEDVLFLRALGRSRRGDSSGARVLAREYLRRYPAGFRAVEAGEMAREPPRAALGASPGLVTFP
jgi:ferric-dicitrate binding protein FerR (iron transport regulator)